MNQMMIMNQRRMTGNFKFVIRNLKLLIDCMGMHPRLKQMMIMNQHRMSMTLRDARVRTGSGSDRIPEPQLSGTRIFTTKAQRTQSNTKSLSSLSL